MWHSMYQLIRDSNAASLYVKAFLDRKEAPEFKDDFEDGTKELRVYSSK